LKPATKPDRKIGTKGLSANTKRLLATCPEPQLTCSSTTEQDQTLAENFSMAELQNVLDACDVHKTPGPDELSYQELRNLPLSGKECFVKVIDRYWRNSTFPSEWKKRVVMPVPKQDKRLNKIEIFRSITLTSCAGIVYERLIKPR